MAQSVHRPHARFMRSWLLFLMLFNGLAASVWAQEPADDFTQAELDQMLAPIALYPDALLSHILIASTYPLEVVMADRWVRNNPGLSGDDAINAVDDQDWDPSVKALVAFPDVLKRMSEDVEWTERLGEAFLADEELVLSRVQNLRQHAYDAGNLADVEHVRVVKKERHIIIEPAVREVIYVPYYDTRVVYGSWWWSSYPPVYWHHHHHHYRPHLVYHRPIFWGPRISLSWGFYFSNVHWTNRHVVVVHRQHFSKPHFARDYSVARHRHAVRWEHQVQHRRGVAYRHPQVVQRYEAPRRSAMRTTSTQISTRLKSDDGAIERVRRDDAPRSTRELKQRDNRDDQQRSERASLEKANRDVKRDARLTTQEATQPTRDSISERLRNARPSDSDSANDIDRDAVVRSHGSSDKRADKSGLNRESLRASEPRLSNKWEGRAMRDSAREPAPRVDRSTSRPNVARSEISRPTRSQTPSRPSGMRTQRSEGGIQRR